MMKFRYARMLMALGLVMLFESTSIWAKVDLSDLNNPFGNEGAPFIGSISITANQVFLDDPRLGEVNDSLSPGGGNGWGAINFNGYFGVYEFGFGLEPLVGVGIIKNSTRLTAATKNNYFMLNGSVGARYKPFGPEVFFIEPYIQSLFRYNFLHIKTGSNQAQNGGDCGMEFGGGLIVSFFVDAARKDAMRSEWGIKDFGLMTSTRFIKGGWFTKAPYGIETGGWDFGLGLFIDW